MAEELHFTLAQRHAVKNQWRLYKEVARVMNREGIVGIEGLHGASSLSVPLLTLGGGVKGEVVGPHPVVLERRGGPGPAAGNALAGGASWVAASRLRTRCRTCTTSSARSTGVAGRYGCDGGHGAGTARDRKSVV